MLQATAIPTPTVDTTTPSPRGTLHITLPVNFMQDPTNSLPLMLKCFTRQQLSVLILVYYSAVLECFHLQFKTI